MDAAESSATGAASKAAGEAGRLLFAKPVAFVAGVASLAQLPLSSLPEVAFAGRSNVGKSSLLNALTGRKALARTSHTPGRTQQLNFFNLDARVMLVDLPGYGYAQTSKSKIAAWTGLMHDYFRGRADLRRIFILIDSRHGLKQNDLEIMQLLDQSAASYQLVLTKVDKIKQDRLRAIRQASADALRQRPAAHPDIIATSAHKLVGIEELRAAVATLALPAEP